MKNTKWLLLVALAAFAVACDPYSEIDNGPARIIGVTATDGETAAMGVQQPDGSWLVQDEADDAADETDTNELASACLQGVAGGVIGTAGQSVYWVHFDKQINGGSVQESLQSCAPAPADFDVTMTGDFTNVGEPLSPDQTGYARAWYSCYQPASPSENEGGSVVIFLSPAVTADDAATCADESVTAPGGWSGWETFDVDPKTTTTVAITGTVKDNGGRDIPINIRSVYGPNVGPTNNLVATAVPAAGSVTLNWDPAYCASTETTYEVRELQADGSWAAVTGGTGLPSTTNTFTVTGVAAGTYPSYSVWTITTEGAATVAKLANSTESVNLTLPAPADLAFTVNTVTLPADQADFRNRPVFTWTKVAGAEQYGVYRQTGAIGGGTVVGAQFTRVGTVAQPADPQNTVTFTDMSSSAGSRYSYFVTSEVDVDGATTQSVRSAYADVLLYPATPAAPTATSVEDTAIVISWRSGPTSRGRLTQYDVQRAPASGDPWVTIGTVAAASPPSDPSVLNLSFTDDGTTAAGALTPATTYLYRLIARNGRGDSRNGSPAEVTTQLLPTPAAPTVTVAGSTATVSWTAVAGASGYDVYRSRNCGDGYRDDVLIATGLTSTTYDDAGSPLRPAGNYRYSIVATAASGTSAQSAYSTPDVALP